MVHEAIWKRMEWNGMFILQHGAVMATLDSAALDHAADSCIFVGETKKKDSFNIKPLPV